MNNTNQKLSADDIEALLPWYAAGTLDAREADQVESAIAADAELARRLDLVREEMTEAIVVNEALGAPSRRVRDNLFKAIDRERRTSRGQAQGGLMGWFSDMLTPRAFAFASGAAILLIALEAGVITKLVLQDRVQPSVYKTASTVEANTRGFEVGALAQVRFAPQASMAELTRFLDSRDAMIVEGPRAGLYKVRIGRSYIPKEEHEHVVREFQSASNIVLAAMPTE
jgi:anti-sigma factor RsiW